MILPTNTRLRACLLWTLVVTLVAEAVTLSMRFGTGLTATEFNRTAPLLLQIHHMFWSIPVLLPLVFLWKRPHISGTLVGVAFGFIISDLAHHFVVLPITVGHTGWHWP